MILKTPDYVALARPRLELVASNGAGYDPAPARQAVTTTADAAARRLRAALAAALVTSPAPELELVHRWLDSWRGIGDIVMGMFRQGWDVQLIDYGDGHWRATFYVTGQAYSIVGGSAWEAAPWTADLKSAGIIRSERDWHRALTTSTG
jgi:hypothetical protein